ncbi:hypothetical protein SD80_016800 [Scytonema tolypothrichoides VB-61278]|nr:hypothetical protein SD80_016800 [Scytonema tolypothrichoides VB-61278]
MMSHSCFFPLSKFGVGSHSTFSILPHPSPPHPPPQTNKRSTVIITTVNDRDFDAKIQAAIRQQMSDSG